MPFLPPNQQRQSTEGDQYTYNCCSVEAGKGKVDLKSVLLLVRGKKFCIVKDGLFYVFEKSASKKPSCCFPLQGTSSVELGYRFVTVLHVKYSSLIDKLFIDCIQLKGPFKVISFAVTM